MLVTGFVKLPDDAVLGWFVPPKTAAGRCGWPGGLVTWASVFRGTAVPPVVQFLGSTSLRRLVLGSPTQSSRNLREQAT